MFHSDALPKIVKTMGEIWKTVYLGHSVFAPGSISTKGK
jgi:hypothetical protein